MKNKKIDHQKELVQEIREKLGQISLFQTVKKAEDLELLATYFQNRKYSQSTHIIKEGESGDEMYILLHGEVEIQKKTRAGDHFTVVKLKDTYNVFFGELALVDDDSRSATVIADTECDLLVLNKNSFNQLGKIRPDVVLPITQEITRTLAGRLRKTTEDMMTLYDALVQELE